MSSRTTRFSARLAEQVASNPASAESTSTNTGLPGQTPNPASTTTSRKRKAPRRSPGNTSDQEESPPAKKPNPKRTNKRAKVSEAEGKSTAAPAAIATKPTRGKRGKQQTTMDPSSATQTAGEASGSSKRQNSRSKKTNQGKLLSGLYRNLLLTVSLDLDGRTPSRSQRRSTARASKADTDVTMKDAEESGRRSSGMEDDDGTPTFDEESEDNDDDVNPQDEDDVDDDDDLMDPFTGGFLGRHPLGLSGAMRALSGIMMGMSSQLREILVQLRQRDDPSVQLIALQELSQILLMSTEETLSGQFLPDPYVKELVTLMQPPDFGEENPEVMILACRCLAHMMDVMRGSVANVVYGGAVPVLCQKLLDIQYIDLAEQALSVGCPFSKLFLGPDCSLVGDVMIFNAQD